MDETETDTCFRDVLKLNDDTRGAIKAAGAKVMSDLTDWHATQHKTFENSLKGQNIVIQPVPMSNIRLYTDLIRTWNTCDVTWVAGHFTTESLREFKTYSLQKKKRSDSKLEQAKPPKLVKKVKFITWLTDFEDWMRSYITDTHDCPIWWIARDVVEPFKDVEQANRPFVPLDTCCLGSWKNSGLDIPACSDIPELSLIHI